MIHPILQLFQEQSSLYRLKEIGDGTHDFTKRVLEGIFGLAPKSSLVPESSLFGESLYDNFYIYEGSRKQGAAARWDFRCKINGQLVVVETERLDNIEAGMKQIGGYMTAENTNFGIVTDGGIWRFFKHGADHLDQYETLTIEQLCSTDGQAFLQNFYNSYDFYLQRLTSVESKSFDTQIFHQGLITTAERIVFDLRHIGLFTGSSQEVAKEEIQTAYSIIIQILLIKIVQDKRKINLLKKDIIIDKLKKEDRNGIFEAVEGQLKWLGDFYTPYHNQQDTLLNKIITHYQQGSRIAKLNLDSVRLFLDLYHFIYSFDFKDVKQDLFGAVYENYLKELYKDDDTKKGQVFTPPEIVEFMLNEVGYTVEYIQQTITDNLPSLKANIDDHTYNIDGLSLIDPACGSGTFLYKSAGRIVNALYNIRKDNKIDDNQAGKIAELLICNNIVGFDIEPFPLYLAEMNILQSLLFFNVSTDGNILNSIDTQIKIFSTDDSIAEFHNLESSMEKDLQDLITGGDFTTLASKRDPKSILQLKADLQDFDREALMTKFQLELYHKALQNDFFMIDDGSLIKTKAKTYRDKHHKKIVSLTSVKDLLVYVRETLDERYLGLFEKNATALKPQLDYIRSELTGIITKAQAKRTKFDFVVANPPYIQMLIQNGGNKTSLSLDNFIGNDQLNKYGSTRGANINLFHKFILLGLFLQKEGGKLSFIVPGELNSQISATQIRGYINQNMKIERYFDFNDVQIFYDRGLNGKFTVATTSCIFCLSKIKPTLDHQIYYYNYDYNDPEKLFQTEIKKIKNLFTESKILQKNINSNWKLGFSGKQINGDTLSMYCENNSLLINKMTEIDKKQAMDINNNTIDGINTFYFISYSTIYQPPQKIDKYYDISILPFNSSRILPLHLLKTKYKIVWNKINNKNNKIKFMFVDYPIIRHNNGYLALGGDEMFEILYLYGLLSSNNGQQILKDVISEQGNSYQMNIGDISNFIVPFLDTSIKLTLKSDLIANSEAIITLCKQGTSGGPQTRGDICETVFDPDSLGEKITGLKTQYNNLGISIPSSTQTSDVLSDDILILLSSEISDLAKLEHERDEIVKKLYELD